MLTPDHSLECRRARDAASARLDGPLPELDEARLDAHLDGCDDCRTFAAEAGALAALLRAAPLEQPGRPLFVPASAPAPAPRAARKRPVVRVQALAAAVVLLAAAIGSSFALGRALGGHRSAFSAVTATPADVLGLRADSAQQHMLAMLPPLEPSFSLHAGRVIAV